MANKVVDSTRSRDESLQDRINTPVYHSEGVDAAYKSRQLTLEETVALLKYQPAFAGRDVLDIGVGTGRTTSFLAPLARRYEGIDYSPQMLKSFRRLLPEVPVQQADMRDLSRFATGSFDFVMAADNIIDAVSHEDRRRVLSGIHRVLRPQGIFVFSSHNRGNPRAQRGPVLERHRNPFTQVRLCAQYLRQLVNHSRVGRYRQNLPEYSLLNDRGHEYALLHYYIERDVQARQLASHGFQLLDVFDRRGELVPPGEHAPESASLLYVARRDNSLA